MGGTLPDHPGRPPRRGPGLDRGGSPVQRLRPAPARDRSPEPPLCSTERGRRRRG